MTPPPISLAAAKRACRRTAIARRAAAWAAAPQAGEALCRALAASRLLRRRADLIGGYVAFGSEIDAQPLLRLCLRLNRRLALPVIVRDGLRFVAWDGMRPLVRGRRGVRVPVRAAAGVPELVPEIVPEILFVPLLAYDGAGHRLGRGGGHYDRFLARTRTRHAVLAIGLAFAEQKMAQLPHGGSDQKLDAVCTPHGLAWMRAGMAA